MIDLIPDTDQQQIADSVRSYLADALPLARLARKADARLPREADTWAGLAELGAFSLSLAEDAGGMGLTAAEEVLAFREYGRQLISPCVLSTVLAVHIAQRSGQAELLESLVAGRRRAALAIPLSLVSSARVLDGEAQLLDAGPDDLIVVWDQAGIALAAPQSCTRVATRCTDETIDLAVAHFAVATPLASLGAEDGELPALATVLSAAMLVGIAEAARDMAVEQAKNRVQFGQPIGTFQAIKHRCADMALHAEAAWSQTVYASLALAQGLPDARFQAGAAKLVADRAACEAASENIQVHGAMGYTEEVHAHLLLKRARVWLQVGGHTHAQASELLRLAPAS